MPEVVLAAYGRHPITQVPYPPHRTQVLVDSWVQAVRQGLLPTKGTPVLYLQHGVNSGGTRALLKPLLNYLLTTPQLRVLIGRKDFRDLRLSVMETFLGILPPVLLVRENTQEHWHEVRVHGTQHTSRVFWSELKDIPGKGSQEFAVIMVNEAAELTHAMYQTLKIRCRQGLLPAFLLLEGNPPLPGHWLAQVQDPRQPLYDPDLTVLTMSSMENWQFMTPAYRASLESLPPMWKKRMVLAEIGGLPRGQAVYPAFVEPVHVGETHVVPDRPVLRFWDWGFRRPAVLWAQQEDGGRLLVHREWSPLEIPVETFLDGAIQRTNEHFGALVCKDYGDPAGQQRDPTGLSTLTRLKRRGLTLVYRPTTYADRIPLVNRKLSELIEGLPAIQINPICRTLIEGLSGGYHYPDLEEGRVFTAQKDLPFKDGVYEHLANAFEYGIVNLFGGTPSAVLEQQLRRQRRWQESASATWRGF